MAEPGKERITIESTEIRGEPIVILKIAVCKQVRIPELIAQMDLTVNLIRFELSGNGAIQ